jgi:hypothetical protein
MVISLILLEVLTVDFLARAGASLARRRGRRSITVWVCAVVLGALAVASLAAGVWHYLVLLGLRSY